jgi:hypothetical protein
MILQRYGNFLKKQNKIRLFFRVKQHFSKSRAWLMQKVNGNIVHGKRKTFTDSERETFRKALQDLSEKMSAVAMTL